MLLDIRTALKVILLATAAVMVYGTTLCLRGEFFQSLDVQPVMDPTYTVCLRNPTSACTSYTSYSDICLWETMLFANLCKHSMRGHIQYWNELISCTNWTLMVAQTLSVNRLKCAYTCASILIFIVSTTHNLNLYPSNNYDSSHPFRTLCTVAQTCLKVTG